MSTSAVTGRRLGALILSYLAMTVVVITLAPFRFAPFPVNGVTLGGNAFDVVMNVVMFVPIGFVFQLSQPRGSGASVSLGAAALGFGLSLLVETAQLFTPGRFPSVLDLVTNTVGAVLGAGLAARLAAAGEARHTVRALAFDLPLMGLVYLMAPLSWLVGLGSEDSARAWILAPLAAAAGWILASVFTSFEAARPTRVLGVTGAWLSIALVPAAARFSGVAAAVAGVALSTALARTIAPAGITHEVREGRPRRFEAKTLRVALPLFAVYLTISALTPTAPPSDAWSWSIALVPPDDRLDDAALFRALEQIAAFTLGGYAVAEYLGRSRDSFRALAFPLLAGAIAVSTMFQVLRGWHPHYGASGALFACTVIGAGLGGWLYVLQLAHVRALTSRPSRAEGLRS